MGDVVVDTSAVVAILLREPDAETVADRILAFSRAWMSVANALECVMVARGAIGDKAPGAVDAVFEKLALSLAPVSEEQYRVARGAFLRFGKGTGHPARLNFGDCFAYALAMDLGAPLLFKGEDFTRTDVAVAA
jgi:ribonuclease VapC